ncbi:class I SAM-dependent methyltransferase [Candidatus Woesearchaeota archaeon]|nr:class I SAM-dependent methyltransferase [Candidatus Woesearchaeota archaeon]
MIQKEKETLEDGFENRKKYLKNSNIEVKFGDLIMELPEDIYRSKLSPSEPEIKWLCEYLQSKKEEYNVKTVLEFSCGITSWAVQEGLRPEIHVSVEQYRPLMKTVSAKYPNIEIIETWEDIPDRKYDLVFVDGSTGAPLKMYPGGKISVLRKQALEWSEPLQSPGAIIISHDWRKRNRAYRVLRNHLVENYDLQAQEYDFAIFKNRKKS